MKPEVIKKLYALEKKAFDKELRLPYKDFEAECNSSKSIVKYLQINGEYRAFIILRESAYTSGSYCDYVRPTDHELFEKTDKEAFDDFHNGNDFYYVVDVVSKIKNGMSILIDQLDIEPTFVVYHCLKYDTKQQFNWQSKGYHLYYYNESKGHYPGEWVFVVMRRN